LPYCRCAERLKAHLDHSGEPSITWLLWEMPKSISSSINVSSLPMSNP
jgi:hypothetical protein